MAEATTQDAITQVPRTEHRSLTERIVVTGVLELTRPAHFGNGDADDSTDLPLLVDEVDKSAVITGASLAGALRNYLREREWGYELVLPTRNPQAAEYSYGAWNESRIMAGRLFGGHRGDAEGAQSPLIVDDARSTESARPRVELRDGVALNSATRTAQEKKKYDYQLLAAGTSFNLRFELLLDDKNDENEKRKKAMALALQGLAAKEIRLGARKRRGFGCCQVAEWKVTRYNLREPDDLIAWLAAGHLERSDQEWELEHKPQCISGPDIAALLNVELKDAEDQRESFEIEADFEIDGSVLVRSGFGNQDQGPDVVHLHTWSAEMQARTPILPGTSIAGAIRQRALRIANTLALPQSGAPEFISSMFGPAEIKKSEDARASRVLVNEEFIAGGLVDEQARVQSRIKIDRFTGGTIETALFEEVPHFNGTVKIGLALRNPEEDEIGLLLLVLKDLWLGDLPLGGESSVGRGRLRGKSATLSLRRHPKSGLDQWRITMRANPDGSITLESDAADATATLEAYIRALQQKSWGGEQ